MASASRRRRRESAPISFFVDRSLGKLHVPAVFREAGFDLVLMSELYPHGEDQTVHDDRWIADVSELGFVALTKDASIVRHHAAALSASTLRVFALTNANLTGPQMAARFRGNLRQVLRRAANPGPFVDVVGPSRVSRRWPR